MGSLVLLLGGLIYLDANCFIYAIERVEPYLTLRNRFGNARGRGRLRL